MFEKTSTPEGRSKRWYPRGERKGFRFFTGKEKGIRNGGDNRLENKGEKWGERQKERTKKKRSPLRKRGGRLKGAKNRKPLRKGKLRGNP